jgi:hypothetical protein
MTQSLSTFILVKKKYELKHSTIGWGRGGSKKGNDAILHGFVHGYGYLTKIRVACLEENQSGEISCDETVQELSGSM